MVIESRCSPILPGNRRGMRELAVGRLCHHRAFRETDPPRPVEPFSDRSNPLALDWTREMCRMIIGVNGGPVKRRLWRLDRSSLCWCHARLALACLVASCAAERRNTGAETELAIQQRAPAETPPLAPKPAAVKVYNVAPGRFVLEADAPTQVVADGALERRADDGSWTPVPFRLRRECAPAGASEGSECIDVLPGQPFVALSWNGADCGPCCYSDTPVPVEPGAYRLAPRACGGNSAGWEGPTFDLPGTSSVIVPSVRLLPSSFVLERFRAAANIETASAFKLEPPGPHDARDRGTVDSAMVIGRPIVPGSEATLSPELVSRLTEWLGNPAGFNNVFNRRCETGDRYGFRLTRNVPHVGREVTELAIELRCNWITIANQEGSLRPRVYSYFDESRGAFVALLRQAMLPSFRDAIPER